MSALLSRFRVESRAQMFRVAVAGGLVAATVLAWPSSADTGAMGAKGGGCDVSQQPRGGDWAMLGGNLEQTNFQAAEHVIGPDNVDQLELKWASSPKVDPGQSTPAVAGNCVFFTGSGHVVALDAATGKLAWRARKVLKPGGDSVLTYYPQGVSVVNGRVHVDAGNGNKPQGNAFDAQTGKWEWTSKSVTFGYQATQLSTPKVADGIHVLFTTGPDYNPHGRPGYALLDEQTGKILAKHQTTPKKLTKKGYAGGGIWATAAVDAKHNYLYVGTSNPYTKTKESPYDNAIIKLDLDRHRKTFGKIVKTYKGVPDAIVEQAYDTPACQILGPVMPAQNYAYLECAQQDADFAAGPTLFRDDKGRQLLAEMQKDGTLHVVDTATMKAVWTKTIGVNNNAEGTGGNGAQVAYDGKRIYAVFNPGTLVALDPATGDIDWVVPAQDDFTSLRPVTAANGVVYTIGAFDSTIVAHDASDGSILATFSPAADSGTSCNAGSTGGLAIANHMLYLNCGAYIAAYGLPGQE